MKKLYIPLLMTTLSFSAFAGWHYSSVNPEREKIIHQYILDLGKADHQGISALFEENGKVVSTSRGIVNAKDFFSTFLPNIESATTEFHEVFVSKLDNDHYAARFHFNFKLKDGETGNGEYVDEFLFNKNSTKLSRVYMFENLAYQFENLKK